jgi:predicted nuclease of restriction endonuclease-like (RecB) superfamily
MNKDITKLDDYKEWIKELKSRLRESQLKASIAVNEELLNFYWSLGSDIVNKQKNSSWGDGLLTQLSKDLMEEFPDMKGFSKRNLEQIRKWYRFWLSISTITKQVASQLTKIPWWHNVVIVTKCKSPEEALYYVQSTIANGWSRSVLVHQIESNLYEREGKAVNNFSKTLPSLQSDLAKQTLKDPYNFDFLTITNEYNEKELEQGLIQHITHFLLELGKGFAYIGKQIQLQVGEFMS